MFDFLANPKPLATSERSSLLESMLPRGLGNTNSRADHIWVFMLLKWEGQLGVRHEKNVAPLRQTQYSRHSGPNTAGRGKDTQRKEKGR